MEVINDAGMANVPDETKMSLGWCLKAGQISSGDAESNTFDPTGVFTQDPVTMAWLKQRLNTTMGIEEAPLQQVWGYPSQGLRPAPQPVINMPAGATTS